jgi:hypothetical protein
MKLEQSDMQEIILSSKVWRTEAPLPLQLDLSYPTSGTKKVPFDYFGTWRLMRTGTFPSLDHLHGLWFFNCSEHSIFSTAR